MATHDELLDSLTTEDQVEVILSAVEKGWNPSVHAFQGYTIADLREVDIFHRYWINSTHLKKSTMVDDAVRTAAREALVYVSNRDE